MRLPEPCNSPPQRTWRDTPAVAPGWLCAWIGLVVVMIAVGGSVL